MNIKWSWLVFTFVGLLIASSFNFTIAQWNDSNNDRNALLDNYDRANAMSAYASKLKPVTQTETTSEFFLEQGTSAELMR